jgi:hypothetical protein
MADQPIPNPSGEPHPAAQDPNREPPSAADHPSGPAGLAGRLRAAMALLPPVLGAPTQPLEVGRTSRVVQPGQRLALAVRDGGCVFPDCARPLAWCEAHHLRHWLHGGPLIWPIWRCCAGPITGRSMRAAGGCNDTPTAG